MLRCTQHDTERDTGTVTLCGNCFQAVVLRKRGYHRLASERPRQLSPQIRLWCFADQSTGADGEPVDLILGSLSNDIAVGACIGYALFDVSSSLSKDSGADVIVERWKRGRTAVQVKQSKNRVTVKAVQEVVSSLRHYRSERGLVVTNSFYTRPAMKLARENGVELWDRNRLLQEIDLANCKLKGKASSYYRIRYLLLRAEMVLAKLGRRISAA